MMIVLLHYIRVNDKFPGLCDFCCQKQTNKKKLKSSDIFCGHCWMNSSSLVKTLHFSGDMREEAAKSTLISCLSVLDSPPEGKHH